MRILLLLLFAFPAMAENFYYCEGFPKTSFNEKDALGKTCGRIPDPEDFYFQDVEIRGGIAVEDSAKKADVKREIQESVEAATTMKQDCAAKIAAIDSVKTVEEAVALIKCVLNR